MPKIYVFYCNRLYNIIVFMSKSETAINFTLFEEFSKRRVSKSEKRRFQIIEKTITELATNGIDSITHDSLAKSCKVSRSLIQHYFPDRDELFLLAFRYVRAKFQKLCVDEMQKHDSAQKKLKAYIECACSWPKVAPDDCKVWLLFYYHCGIKREYKTLNSELVEQGHARILALLNDIIGNKKTNDPINITRAKLIQNLITSYFLSVMTENNSKEFNAELLGATVQLCLSYTRL